MRYTIVKYASTEDLTTGVRIEASAHWTTTGKDLGILESYELQSLAQSDCRRMNHLNPSGCYVVCPVIEKEPVAKVKSTTSYAGYIYVDADNKPIMEIVGGTREQLESYLHARYSDVIIMLMKRSGCKIKKCSIVIDD